jgi:hypothetical protein
MSIVRHGLSDNALITSAGSVGKKPTFLNNFTLRMERILSAVPLEYLLRADETNSLPLYSQERSSGLAEKNLQRPSRSSTPLLEI